MSFETHSRTDSNPEKDQLKRSQRVNILGTRFCLECENFEDRKEIDGHVVCAKNHEPGFSCEDFQDKSEKPRETLVKTRFCLECENFEDRRDIDGSVVCTKNHGPRISCPDFQDRRIHTFYSAIYWASMYNVGKTNFDAERLESQFSRSLTQEELAYACLLNYFELAIDDSHFYDCWKVIRKNYRETLPTLSNILDAALNRLIVHNEDTDMVSVFTDLLFSKDAENTIKLLRTGHYARGKPKTGHE